MAEVQNEKKQCPLVWRDVTVDIEDENVEQNVKELVMIVRESWKTEEVKIKKLSGGWVNILYCCHLPSDEDLRDAVIFRIFKVASMLDRSQEVLHMQIAANAGVAGRVLAIFKNGVIYTSSAGRNPKFEELHDPKVISAAMETLAKFHLHDQEKDQLINFSGEIAKYEPCVCHSLHPHFEETLSKIPDRLKDEDEQENSRYQQTFKKDWLGSEFKLIMEKLKSLNYPLVRNHCDWHLWNMIYDPQTGKMEMIDFEVAGLAYDGFDIAFMLDNYPFYITIGLLDKDNPTPPFSAETRKLYVKYYLQHRAVLQGKSAEDVSQEDVDKYSSIVESLTPVPIFGVMITMLSVLEPQVASLGLLKFCYQNMDTYTKIRHRLFGFTPT